MSDIANIVWSSRTTREKMKMARLHAAGGRQDDDDAVARRQRFEETHPDVTISPPETHASLWTARRDGKILATGYHLCDLMDTLDWVLSR
jgi:hypothetical protein